MKGLVKLFIVVIAVVILILLYNSYKYEGASTSYMSAVRAVQLDLPTVFNEVVKSRYEEISQCILDKFLERYTLAEAQALITEDAFKTNAAVIADLQACKFLILKQWYAIAQQAITGNACVKENMKEAVKWITEKVPYEIQTDDQIKGHLANLYTFMATRCWTEDKIKDAVDRTITKITDLTKKGITEENYKIPFVSYKRNKDWIDAISKVMVDTYKNESANNSPEAYKFYLTAPKIEHVDKYTENGMSKLVSQAKIYTQLLGGTVIKWCKTPEELLKRMETVPFEVYTDQKITELVSALFQASCWSPAALKERTIDVLKKII